MSDSFAPFRPVFRNPHLATVLTTFWPRPFDARRYPVQTRLFHTESDVQVLIHTQRPENSHGEVVLVHGLEGSSHAPYMLSMAQALLDEGLTVHRTNIRTCGGTEFLCSTLYHAGLTKDILAILTDLDRQRRTPAYLVGFSLGGNQVLKMAGELGADARRLLAGAVAISTPIDLAECCRMLARPSNRLYEWRFLSSMRKRLRLRRPAIAAALPYERLDRVSSVWEFDDLFTGPAFGFTGAEHYYSTQSAIRFLNQIRVPTLVVQAQDDPMIPFEVFSHPAFENNPNLTLAATQHGGHLGFLSARAPRIWVDDAVRRWISSRL
ncbi:MAG TPA: alpha/beta fold hydrolase [Bryobacteraceae bacterium]|nr:alpha/beta fold hydrolase [Bryobacteraceae bacterium]